MNILLVSGPGISLKEPYNSGIEAFIVSFAKQLCDDGHRVDIVAEDADDDVKFNLINPFTEYYSDHSDDFKQINERSQFEKLPVHSYDLIHYNMFYPHLLNAGLTFKKTSFLTLHSPPDLMRISVYRELLNSNKLNYVAISRRIKEQWDLALDTDIPLINNGIEIDLWPLKKLRKPEYLLWSARITEEKNVTAAIRLAQHMNLPLIIAGRIVNQKYFNEQVQPNLNSQIRYVGHVTQTELSNLSTNAIAYLATATWQEPFGLAALEMLACGVPVVGFNTAVPQNWENAGVLTTASANWQDLAELVEMSYAVSSVTCREFASGMTIQKMTSEYVNLFQEFLRHNSGSENKKNPDHRTEKISFTTQISQ